MNNASVQEIAFKGASLGAALKVLQHVESNGYSGQDFLNIVSQHLNGQIGRDSDISGGRHADHSAPLHAPTIGAAQNSGLSR